MARRYTEKQRDLADEFKRVTSIPWVRSGEGFEQDFVNNEQYLHDAYAEGTRLLASYQRKGE